MSNDKKNRVNQDNTEILDEKDGIDNKKEVVKTYEKISYIAIVWAQFKKNKVAMFCLYCILFLFVVAIYAPIISLDKPFFYNIKELNVTNENSFMINQSMSKEIGKITFPFIRYSFDRNFFENGVDIFFNLIMFLSPFYLIAFFWYKYYIEKVKKKKFINHFTYILKKLFIFQFVLFFLFMVFPRKEIYRNYKDEIKTIEKIGGKVSYLFPLLKYSYRETDITTSNPKAPSFNHLLGTDKEGRDVFVRMLYGTRISLTIGVVAVSIYVIIGIIIGSIAGYFGGKVDLYISRFIEIMMCFPTFFLILTIAAFIDDRSIFHVMIVIGITSWTGIARLVRGEVLRQKNMDYTQAAIALGLSNRKIIFGHVLPNALAPVLVSVSFGIASAILTESSLSFLGLGDTSAPSWGELLSIGRVEQKLWLILTPGLAIFFVVSVFNLVGEALRDALDPKLRQ
jgi:peptide/nickel transport system permease protein